MIPDAGEPCLIDPKQVLAKIKEAFSCPLFGGAEGFKDEEVERLLHPASGHWVVTPEFQHLRDLWAARPTRLFWLAQHPSRQESWWHTALREELRRLRENTWLFFPSESEKATLIKRLRECGETEVAGELARNAHLFPGPENRRYPGDVPNPGVLLVSQRPSGIMISSFVHPSPPLRKTLYEAIWLPSDAEAQGVWHQTLALVHQGLPPTIRVEPVLPLLNLFDLDIEGGSFAISLWLFSWSLIHDHRLPCRAAATGTLVENGCGQIGGVAPESFDLKVLAALSGGYDVVFVPEANVSTDSRWKNHEKVVRVAHVEEIARWLSAREPTKRADRYCRYFLQGKVSSLPEGFDKVVWNSLQKGGFDTLIQHWQQHRCVSLRRFMSTLSATRDAVTQGMNAHIPKGNRGLDGLLAEMRVLQTLLPRRAWLFHLPIFLFLLSGEDPGGAAVAESLYQEAVESFLDHDPDLTLASKILEKTLEDDSKKRKSVSARSVKDSAGEGDRSVNAGKAPAWEKSPFWQNRGFRQRYPLLMWMFLREPIQGAEILTRVSDRSQEEEQWLKGLLQGLADISPEDYAGLGLAHKSLHHAPMARAIKVYLPGFEPEFAPAPPYAERLCALWQLFVRIRGTDLDGLRDSLARHLQAHLEAGRPYGWPPLLAMCPELRCVYEQRPLETRADFREIRQIVERSARQALGGVILRPLGKVIHREEKRASNGVAVPAELEGKTALSKSPSKGWVAEVLTHLANSGRSWSESPIRRRVCEALAFLLTGQYKGRNQKDMVSLACFIDPLTALVNLGTGGRGDRDGFGQWFLGLERSLEMWSQMPRVAMLGQCLAHLAGRLFGRRDDVFDASRLPIPSTLMVPFLSGVLSEASKVGCAVCEANRVFAADSSVVRDLFWLATLPPICVKRCEPFSIKCLAIQSRCLADLKHESAYLRGEATMGLLVLSLLGVPSFPPHLSMATRHIEDWLGSVKNPARRRHEGHMPLLAIWSLDPQAPEHARTLFGSCEKGDLWRDLLRSSKGGAGFSAFATAYWCHLFPRSILAKATAEAFPGFGFPGLWDSESDRRHFWGVLLTLPWIQGDNRGFEQVFLQTVEYLPTLFLGLRLHERAEQPVAVNGPLCGPC